MGQAALRNQDLEALLASSARSLSLGDARRAAARAVAPTAGLAILLGGIALASRSTALLLLAGLGFLLVPVLVFAATAARRPAPARVHRQAAARCADPGEFLAAIGPSDAPLAQLARERAARAARAAGPPPARPRGALERLAPLATLVTLLVLGLLHLEMPRAATSEVPDAPHWLSAPGTEAEPPEATRLESEAPRRRGSESLPSAGDAAARRDALSLARAAEADPRLGEALRTRDPASALRELAERLREGESPPPERPGALEVAASTAADEDLAGALRDLAEATRSGDAGAVGGAVKALGRALEPLDPAVTRGLALAVAGPGGRTPGARGGGPPEAPRPAESGLLTPEGGRTGDGARRRTPREREVLARYFARSPR